MDTGWEQGKYTEENMGTEALAQSRVTMKSTLILEALERNECFGNAFRVK